VSTGQGGETPLDAILQQLAELRDQVSLLEAAHQRDAERIDKLTAADAKAGKPAKDAKAGKPAKDDEGYKPIRAPQWWQQRSGERGNAVERLRSWVETVYRPGYGHLAAKLGPCWPQHDLCLYLLDWLSEMHAFLYQDGDRGWGMLTGQAEWHTRFLLSAVAQMEEETHSCDHLELQDLGPVGGDPWAGTQ
jgi:hypothetical protein